jgi:hypothetical protein
MKVPLTDGESEEISGARGTSGGGEKKWICPVVRAEIKKWQAGQKKSLLSVFSVCRKLINIEMRKNMIRKAR